MEKIPVRANELRVIQAIQAGYDTETTIGRKTQLSYNQIRTIVKNLLDCGYIKNVPNSKKLAVEPAEYRAVRVHAGIVYDKPVEREKVLIEATHKNEFDRIPANGEVTTWVMSPEELEAYRDKAEQKRKLDEMYQKSSKGNY